MSQFPQLKESCPKDNNLTYYTEHKDDVSGIVIILGFIALGLLGSGLWNLFAPLLMEQYLEPKSLSFRQMDVSVESDLLC